jgi:hypothetical protein
VKQGFALTWLQVLQRHFSPVKPGAVQLGLEAVTVLVTGSVALVRSIR